MNIDFYFDFSCPYAYLGSTQIEALAARTHAELRWQPMLLGGVFRALGSPQNMSAGMGAAKAAHNLADMARWADLFSVPLAMPRRHPMKTVRALRALLACEPPRWPALIHRFFSAYWVRGLDLESEPVVAQLLCEAGIEGEAAERALAANGDPAVKDELRARTDRAVTRGVFGAPSLFVTAAGADESFFFWGQDRLDMVEACARGWRPDSAGPASRPPAAEVDSARPAAVIDFWYDFSSPFAYLAAVRAAEVAARAGAELRWRPMLLGGLFRQLGTPLVPLREMSAAKQAYVAADLHASASYWGVPFRFSSHFPIRSVTALRLALLAGDRIAELSVALFHALWAEDRDISDERELARLLATLGFDSGLLAAAQGAEAKTALARETAAAEAEGVFGAPTCVVKRDGARHLFWGQDRLEMAGRAAAGWDPPGPLGAPAGR